MSTVPTESTGIQVNSALSAPATDQIAKALAAAQLEMKNPGFDTTNPHFRNRFASLAAVRNSTLPALAKHGIAVVQDLSTLIDAAGFAISCTTRLYHESGQSLHFGPLVIPANKANAQELGSASTYAKRYALMSVCGVVGDEDDDGNAAVGTQATRGDRSGRPDTSAVDPEEVKGYVEGFTNALINADVNAIMELHHELRTEAELYTAVSDKLSSKQRTDLRKIITEHKEAA